MAFVDTYDSLVKNLDINSVLASALNTRLAKSIDKSVTVTANNNTFTIDPNTSNMFVLNANSNSTIAIFNLDSIYTTNGSAISILLTLSSDNLVISWPNSVKWRDETAPELTHKNLITLMHFGENNWYGGSMIIDDDFQS